MLNNMKSVTAESIAYAALMVRTHFVQLVTLNEHFNKLRHCINSLDDWRVEDDLFKREKFFEYMTAVLDAPDNYWVQDMLSWWNG